VLEVSDLYGGYAKSSALQGVTLHAGEIEVVAILGRNGAGKTTLLKAVMGLLPWSRGSIVLDGEDVSRLPTHRRARRGVGYVPQGRGIFAQATVEENLRYGLLLGRRSMREEIPSGVFEPFPWLKDRLKQAAGTLSGGEQQMLAIARVLVADAKLLLLDEPTEGLAPAIVEQLRDVLLQVRASGKHSVLLVEQNLRFALTLASRGYVMEKGRIVAEGDPAHLEGEEVIARHLSI
jgi:urea ABC transporter ATP-binding protein UrtE